MTTQIALSKIFQLANVTINFNDYNNPLKYDSLYVNIEDAINIVEQLKSKTLTISEAITKVVSMTKESDFYDVITNVNEFNKYNFWDARFPPNSVINPYKVLITGQVYPKGLTSLHSSNIKDNRFYELYFKDDQETMSLDCSNKLFKHNGAAFVTKITLPKIKNILDGQAFNGNFPALKIIDLTNIIENKPNNWGLFISCSALEKVIGLEAFSDVTDFTNSFNFCGIKEIDLSEFHKVTTLDEKHFLFNCNNLTTVYYSDRTSPVLVEALKKKKNIKIIKK